MNEMYNAMPGSPITYLAGDISAAQTTIAIADDTALPDAPNICTIGYGENIETIRYGAKSNGVLQDVTRGIEGTPRAWQSGTEVARFFTAYDHNAIVENIMTHKAESAKKHIAESGSNENGSYIKFDDGTMICRYESATSYTADIDTTFSIYLKSITWTYPATFATVPTVYSSAARVSVGYAWGGGAEIPSRFSTPLIFFSYTNANTFKINAIAIGRWK